MDYTIQRTVLYGSKVWDLAYWSLTLGQDGVCIDAHALSYHQDYVSNSHTIVQAEFVAHSFQLETIFGLVSLLHHTRCFANFTTNSQCYLYLTHYSFKAMVVGF